MTSIIDKKCLTEILYKHREKLGIKKEDVEKYVDVILKKCKEENKIEIPKESKNIYSIYVKGYEKPIAIFIGSYAMLGIYHSPLKGKYYLVGKNGYIKVSENNESKFRESKKLPTEVSEVQLLIISETDKIKIYNVGKNPIRVETREIR